MKIHKNWSCDMTADGTLLGFEPMLDVLLSDQNGQSVHWQFLIDSGAEYSMAPRSLCEFLGIPWEDGQPMVVSGIAGREECNIIGRIHDVEISISGVDRRLVIPIFFASGESVSLIGRRVFFDAFRIEFDQPFRTTTLESLWDELEA